ncbi:hypothetical protein PQX77_017187 [Marasmius sp. AFHP31]|nr:hypothetical protein PQX77_017187 [Marasmius sp. AFHP31]
MNSTNPSIATTSTQLMHASLAYLSLETRTLDAIITIAHPPPILPTEILLLIHQSHSALHRYFRRLCTECRSYNEYVYGDDPWVWDPCGYLPPTKFTDYSLRRALRGMGMMRTRTS